jgi:hypothetical protein
MIEERLWMWTSREIVTQTLQFGRPERVAHSFEPSDFIAASVQIPVPEGQWRRTGKREWRRVDEWGNVWGRVDESSKGEVVRGVLANLSEVTEFPLPDFSDPAYYAPARGVFEAHLDKWHIASIHGFTFSVARKIRRLDQYLMDLLLERDAIRVLHDRVDEQIEWQIRRMREAGADSVMFAEDWGTQLGLFINPALWREEFKPRFRHLCTVAHAAGLRVFMHSCGKMTAIIPDLIEVGVDLLQFDQPQVHGIDKLQELQELGRVTFWCPVDIQKTLQSRDETLIRREAREMLDKLWHGRGGFIAGYYGDNVSIGLEPRWQAIACDEFLTTGRRARYGSG